MDRPAADPPDAVPVVARLAAAGCVAAEAEAAELLAAAPDTGTLERWLRAREDGVPLGWLTGSVVFAGHRLVVAPGVYVPRPQTAELARRAVEALPDHGRAVDLCTGCGAVAAHLRAERPSAGVVGVDLDLGAVRCARANGVPAVVGHLGDPLAAGAFDVVTAVAPYVPTSALALLPADVVRHEPRAALDGGDDGLAVVRRVVAAARRLLAPGGSLLLELGGEQDLALRTTLPAAGFEEAVPWHDAEGDLRGVVARRAPGPTRGGDRPCA
jgi:release factor glutamine methyltransferase